MTPTLPPSKLESGESIIIYNPQLVLWQLGYDKGLIGFFGDTACSRSIVIEISLWIQDFINPPRGRNGVMPRLGHTGVISPMGFLFWQKCIKVLDSFVGDKDESSLDIVMLARPKLGIPSCGSERRLAQWWTSWPQDRVHWLSLEVSKKRPQPEKEGSP